MTHHLVLAAAISLSVLANGCTPRTFGEDLKSISNKAENLDPLPFNALEVLKNPSLLPVLEYPKNYKGNLNIVVGSNGIREVHSDGVFFSSFRDWHTKETFGGPDIGGRLNQGDGVRGPVNEGEGSGGPRTDEVPSGEPTSYAKVLVNDPSNKKSGGILTYELEGRVLSIGFTDVQENAVTKTHDEAVEHCAAKNLRLPTARELFDFCTAGLEPQVVPPAKVKSWAFVNRCVRAYETWSMTLRANNLKQAWGFAGFMRPIDRTDKNAFYCVGSVKK